MRTCRCNAVPIGCNRATPQPHRTSWNAQLVRSAAFLGCVKSTACRGGGLRHQMGTLPGDLSPSVAVTARALCCARLQRPPAAHRRRRCRRCCPRPPAPGRFRAALPLLGRPVSLQSALPHPRAAPRRHPPPLPPPTPPPLSPVAPPTCRRPLLTHQVCPCPHPWPR